MEPIWALWGVFSSSFLAATLLPGGSELVLGYAATQQPEQLPLLWGLATLGNTLGGLSSWAVGWLIARRYPGERLNHPRQRRAVAWVRRHGSPLLLLSWLPLIGDPLCVAAGWSGIGVLRSLLFIALGKGARYAMLLAALGYG